MSILYKPVLIESAEQAEVLPEGTIIIHAENYPQEKFAGLWGREGNSSASLAEEEGWTALVPVEATEETREHPTRVEERTGYVYHQPVRQIRYRTRWEDQA